MLDRYWVDASKQGLILKHVASSGGSKKTEMRIKYNKDPEHGWIPMLWHGTFVGNSIDGIVTKQSIGRPLNEDEGFTIAYPPETVVFDQDRGKRYRVQKDGSMEPIEPAP